MPTVQGIKQCSDDVWAAWLRLRSLVTGETTGEPVRYGPGRGLWVPGRGWVITCGPGGLGRVGWPSKLGRAFPSFHCTSWTNFVLGWLTCRDALYTHSGNIPLLRVICTRDAALHQQAGARAYRGYAPRCSLLPSDAYESIVSWDDVIERQAELGSFNVFEQSTKRQDGVWRRWHHTGVLVRNPTTGEMERIAADGSSKGGYSGEPMDAERVNDVFAMKMRRKQQIRVYRVLPDPDGTYSGDGRVPTDASLEAV
jgi:hypothetical protein